jgi:hypothetical protein
MGTSSKGKLRISFTQGLSKKDKDGKQDTVLRQNVSRIRGAFGKPKCLK